tara:strand:+ start:124 stop:468 length:345 start_codon:yes stop_codon:yes gene_type:complete
MPVYYVDIPVLKLKINILNRSLDISYLYRIMDRVVESGIKHPIILIDKGTELECLLGNTRIQVAIILKIPIIACLLITNKYYKDLKRVESFEDFMCQVNLTNYDLQRGLLKAIL